MNDRQETFYEPISDACRCHFPLMAQHRLPELHIICDGKAKVKRGYYCTLGMSMCSAVKHDKNVAQET